MSAKSKNKKPAAKTPQRSKQPKVIPMSDNEKTEEKTPETQTTQQPAEPSPVTATLPEVPENIALMPVLELNREPASPPAPEARKRILFNAPQAPVGDPPVVLDEASRAALREAGVLVDEVASHIVTSPLEATGATSEGTTAPASDPSPQQPDQSTLDADLRELVANEKAMAAAERAQAESQLATAKPPAPTGWSAADRFALAKRVSIRGQEVTARAAGNFLAMAEIARELRDTIPASAASDEVILKLTELSGGLPSAAFRLAKMALVLEGANGALELDHIETVRKGVAGAMLSADPQHLEWLRALVRGKTDLPANALPDLLQWQLVLLIPGSDPAAQPTAIIHPTVMPEL